MYLVVGKTIFGAPLKLVLTVITQNRVTAMTIAQIQRQMTNMHMKALKYIGHMKKNVDQDPALDNTDPDPTPCL